MGRVLAGASLAAFVLTAVVTVDACVLELRAGADQNALVAQQECLERLRAKLIEDESSLDSLEALTIRAARAGHPLRVPGLPESFTQGARARPLFSPTLSGGYPTEIPATLPRN